MTYQEYRLGDICRLVKGTFSSTKTLPGEYPLVVTAAQRRTADGFDLEGPAVCIPLISSTGHGDAAIHRLHYQEGPFALANLLVALIPLPDSPANAEYLYWYLTAKKDEVLVPLMRGTANVSLKEKDIAEVYVPLPPLPEQQRIVARVKGLLAKVEEATRLREEVDKSISLLSFLAGKSTFARHSFPSESFGRVFDLEGGSQPPKSMFRHEESEGYVRFLQIRDFSSDEYLTYIPFSSRNSYVESGEILIGRYGASIGKILTGKQGAYNVAMCKIVPKENIEIDREFLIIWLKFGGFQERIRSISRSAQAGFNKGDLKDLPVPLPSLEVQKQIAAEINQFNQLQSNLLESQFSALTQLQALPASILAQAFAGAL